MESFNFQEKGKLNRKTNSRYTQKEINEMRGLLFKTLQFNQHLEPF